MCLAKLARASDSVALSLASPESLAGANESQESQGSKPAVLGYSAAVVLMPFVAGSRRRDRGWMLRTRRSSGRVA